MVYIADSDNHVVRNVTSDSIINTFAGNGIISYKGDGGPASSASLIIPRGVAVSSSGVVYIADTFNHAIRNVT